MSEVFHFFASTAKGISSILLDELRALALPSLKESPTGVSFSGTLADGYRACLWSRTASRILLALDNFYAPDPTALYTGIKAIDWSQHMTTQQTFAVDFSLSNSNITHSHFAALKVKDAIVDQFREACGERPSIELQQPAIRINVYLNRDQAHVSLDLSGDSLHRRGYRQSGMEAPLKENLAAALLLRAHWPDIAKEGGALIDPMCGSGTLAIEAALMAGDIAPGLGREYYGFLAWQGHDEDYWQTLLCEARARRDQGSARIPPIYGFDANKRAIEAARDNAAGAGLTHNIFFAQGQLTALTSPEKLTPGLVIANPPYGERLGKEQNLPELYGVLGDKLKQHFKGWQAAIFTGNPELGKHMGLRAKRLYKLYNGTLECKLLLFNVTDEFFIDRHDKPFGSKPLAIDAGTEMFINRLRKNLTNLGKWARREQIDCYRLYDADLPEYALAIDLYRGDKLWLHVQEYAAPDSVDIHKAGTRLQQALAVIPDVLGIPAEQMFFKVRKKQKGKAQYEKQDNTGNYYQVPEHGYTFWVNFSAYLDTGLFLDHRLTRALIGQLANNTRFLNLFAYTGSATVYAAKGGAKTTTTVDMSRTYIEWAEKNLRSNGIRGKQHELIQANCLTWLEQQPGKQQYDLIFLDPPTYSSSKRMDQTFDVQRDHVMLLENTLKLLAPGGTLIFSNNKRKFKMQLAERQDIRVENITSKTIPRDFARNTKIHNCWRITKT